MITQSIDRNGTSATWRLLRRRNPQVFIDYFSFSAFTKIFFNFCLWGIVTFTFHCQLSSRFVYKLKRTRLYGKLVNYITVCEFGCLSNAAKNDNNREVFHQILCQLKKIIETKTQVRGQPEENARDCFQRWRLFCQQVTTDPKWYWLRWWPRWYWLGWRQFWWSRNGVDCIVIVLQFNLEDFLIIILKNLSTCFSSQNLNFFYTGYMLDQATQLLQTIHRDFRWYNSR